MCNNQTKQVTTGHIHADLMRQYAEDALTTDKPWINWQCYSTKEQAWINLSQACIWHPSVQYRRKPKTININGFDVPEPCKDKTKIGRFTRYWVVNLSNGHLVLGCSWDNDETDNIRLQNGLIHLTEEAALCHAKALLSFTMTDSKE